MMGKIYYVYQLDPRNRSVQSGRPYALLHELQRTPWEVVPIVVGDEPFRLLRKLLAGAYRATGRAFLKDRFPPYLRVLGLRVDGALRRRQPGDLVFSPSSLPLYRSKLRSPFVVCVDAPFAAMVGYYPDFARLPKWMVRNGLRNEAGIFREASRGIVPSGWAAASIRTSVPEARLSVIPFGANWGAENTRTAVEAWVADRRSSPCRVIFVGRERWRKGLDLVERLARSAEEHGLEVDFDVAGLSGRGWRGSHVGLRFHGLLSPNRLADRERLEALWKGACFLMLPTRAEAYGMSFCEAGAFGVPFLALRTGGVQEICREEVNGHLVPESEFVDRGLDLIRRFYRRPDDYERFCIESFREFERRLNWRVFGERLRESMDDVMRR